MVRNAKPITTRRSTVERARRSQHLAISAPLPQRYNQTGHDHALVPRACQYGIWEPFLTATRTYIDWARIAQAVAMELLREPTRRDKHEWRGKPRQLLVDAGYRPMAGLRGRSRRRRNRPGGVPTGDGPALSPEMAPSKGNLDLRPSQDGTRSPKRLSLSADHRGLRQPPGKASKSTPASFHGIVGLGEAPGQSH